MINREEVYSEVRPSQDLVSTGLLEGEAAEDELLVTRYGALDTIL